MLGEFTGDGVGGIVDVADLILDAHAEEGAGGGGRQGVVLLEPEEHFGGGVLEGLVEWAGVAEGEDSGIVFAAWPAAGFGLEQADGELDVEGGLDAGADDLAIALDGMTIAKVEQGAGDVDGEIEDSAGLDVAIIHVAAVRPEVAEEMACPPAGATPRQPSIGSRGRVKSAKPGRGVMRAAVPAAGSMRQSA